jgi:hypothetical protein
MALIEPLDHYGFVYKGRCKNCTSIVKNKYTSTQLPGIEVILIPSYNNFEIKLKGRKISRGLMPQLREHLDNVYTNHRNKQNKRPVRR